jgi:hypothetical protein
VSPHVQKGRISLELFSLAIAVLLIATPRVTVAAQATEQRETVLPSFSHPIAKNPRKMLSAALANNAPGPLHRHGQSFVVGDLLRINPEQGRQWTRNHIAQGELDLKAMRAPPHWRNGSLHLACEAPGDLRRRH